MSDRVLCLPFFLPREIFFCPTLTFFSSTEKHHNLHLHYLGLCVGQRAPSEDSKCCDSMWLPSLVARTVDELPQGRLQPYYITVDDAGVATWRVEFRGNFYTNLDVEAFPFDKQNLQILFQYVNLRPGDSRVKVRGVGESEEEGRRRRRRDEKEKNQLSYFLSLFPCHQKPTPNPKQITPSARGLHLFSMGRGDDLSSFRTESILMRVWTSAFSRQFNRVSRWLLFSLSFSSFFLRRSSLSPRFF